MANEVTRRASGRDDMSSRWTATAAGLLQGRTITKVRYMTEAEQTESMWGGRAVVLELDNGLLIYPACDPEGNGPGALFTTDPVDGVIPPI